MAGESDKQVHKRTGAVKPSRAGKPVRDRVSMQDLVSWFVARPMLGWGVTIGIGFAILAGLLAAWAREQPRVSVGQILSHTRVVRIEFRLEDEEATERLREMARQRTARVYVGDEPYLQEIAVSLENLPKTLVSVKSLDEVAHEIRAQFHLTEATLAAIQAQVVDDQPSPQWRDAVRKFRRWLETTPLLDDQTWQRATQEGGHYEIALRLGVREIRVARGEVLNVDSTESLTEHVTRAATAAGFDQAVQPIVIARITSAPRPTFRFDASATAASQEASAEAVDPVIVLSPKGQTIFKRGQRLTAAQLNLYKAELANFRTQASAWQIWLRLFSIIGALSVVIGAAMGYIALMCPRLRKNASRMGWFAGIAIILLAFAAIGSVIAPQAQALTTTAPTVFLAAILTIVYNQRTAIALSALHGILVCLALDATIGTYAIIVAGVGAAVWQLKEIRDRNALFRMGVLAAGVLAGTTMLAELTELPMVAGVLKQVFIDAAWAGFGGVAVGAVTLFILRPIERAFDITTGMTLIELRDPKQPLLKMLQQRAPGSYNHSLNVASIAEAAADRIGADSLLTYVGALYHDIGKMNKPEYFVENQFNGPNKHDKLSPAMSLLVIVGHVKDGLEIARQYGLSRSLHHFIEAHHGTTLVEYFYDRAKKQAADQSEGDETQMPEELAYRYPGPKPQTREVAILMLADAVESATRSMAEPTPSRIDAFVHAIANKRLMDGQFDDCALTFRELQTIAESISQSVAAIYHGRIAYPSSTETSSEKSRQQRAGTG